MYISKSIVVYVYVCGFGFMLRIPPVASHGTGAMEAHRALTLKCGMMISCCKDTQFLLKDIHIMKKMCNFAAERGQAPRHVPAIPTL